MTARLRAMRVRHSPGQRPRACERSGAGTRLSHRHKMPDVRSGWLLAMWHAHEVLRSTEQHESNERASGRASKWGKWASESRAPQAPSSVGLRRAQGAVEIAGWAAVGRTASPAPGHDFRI